MGKSRAKLLTEGIYAKTRNPRYLEFLLFCFVYVAFANYSGAWIVYLLTFPAIHLVVLLEDPALLFLDKPPGVPCHPLEPGEVGFITAAITQQVYELAIKPRKNKGGKKDKDKSQKQTAQRKDQRTKEKRDKQPKSTA